MLPLESPIAHVTQQRFERLAFGGELVTKMPGFLGNRDLPHNVMAQELLQPICQDVRRNSLRRRDKILVARLAENQITHHKERPTVTENVEAASDRTRRPPG